MWEVKTNKSGWEFHKKKVGRWALVVTKQPGKCVWTVTKGDVQFAIGRSQFVFVAKLKAMLALKKVMNDGR